MKLIKFSSLTFTLLFILNVQSQKPSAAKAEMVINKSITAMGGINVLKNIQTLFCNSATSMEGHDVNWVTKEMLPNKGSFEIVFQDRTVYKGWFNGKTGYELVEGKKQESNPEEHKDKNYKKNIFNEIDYLDPTLYKLEYVGEEIVGGIVCDKIKTILINGKIKFVYYDKKSNFLLKEETLINANENSFSTVLYSNYKKYGDIFYASEMTMVTESGNQIAKVIELYYNKNITETDFN